MLQIHRVISEPIKAFAGPHLNNLLHVLPARLNHLLRVAEVEVLVVGDQGDGGLHEVPIIDFLVRLHELDDVVEV